MDCLKRLQLTNTYIPEIMIEGAIGPKKLFKSLSNLILSLISIYLIPSVLADGFSLKLFVSIMRFSKSKPSNSSNNLSRIKVKTSM